jgi:hypothetical protein
MDLCPVRISWCLVVSFAAIGVAHDQLPGTVGLAAQNLDCSVADFDSLSRPIESCSLKVGVQESDVADDDLVDDPTVQACFRGDHAGQHLANLVVADNCFTRPGHEARLRFVEGHDGVEIASVEALLEQRGQVSGL